MNISKALTKILLPLFLFVFLTCIYSAKAEAVDSNGQWEQVASLNTPRTQSGFVLLNSGKVLIAGGISSGQQLSSVELFDPITKTWSFTGNLVIPQQVQTGPGVVKFSDGKVLIGGHHYNSQIQGSPITGIYDPSTGIWSNAANINVPRVHAALLPLPGNKAILAGGSTGLSAWSNAAEIYDYATNTWTVANNLNVARQVSLDALALTSGKVMLIGGGNSSGILNTSEIYDPSTGNWTISTMPFYSDFSAIVELSDGKVLAAGSYIGSSILSSAAIYDPSTNIWTSVSPMPEGRAGATAVLLDDGNVLIVGGNDFSNNWTQSLIYNPGTDTWSAGPSLPGAMNGSSYVKLQNGDYLFTAGHEGSAGPQGSTYIFTNGNEAPIANAGVDQVSIVNNTVSLDGSGSNDPDEDSLTYEWTENPTNPATGLLSDLTSVNPNFTPTIAGTYIFSLIVSDGTEDSTSDSVTITVQTAAEAIDDIIDLIVDLNLDNGIQNSLDGKLEAALNALDDLNESNNQAAINSLLAFINKVEQKRGLELTNEEAESLIAAAQAIIDSLTP